MKVIWGNRSKFCVNLGENSLSKNSIFAKFNYALNKCSFTSDKFAWQFVGISSLYSWKLVKKWPLTRTPEKFCVMTYSFFELIWKCIVSVMFCVNLNQFSIVEIFLLQLLCCSYGISLYFLCKYELFITNFWNTPTQNKMRDDHIFFSLILTYQGMLYLILNLNRFSIVETN